MKQFCLMNRLGTGQELSGGDSLAAAVRANDLLRTRLYAAFKMLFKLRVQL